MARPPGRWRSCGAIICTSMLDATVDQPVVFSQQGFQAIRTACPGCLPFPSDNGVYFELTFSFP
jgi:hypothetical protein